MLAHKRREPGTEARKTKRKPIKIEITLIGDHNFYVGFAENISAGGVFVATHEPHEIGSEVKLELTLPNLEKPIRTKGTVRWVRPYRESNDGPAGVGLAFVDLPAEEAEAVHAFTQERPPIFYE
jgi:uncharacterized protein (TIGR02266 family)